MQSLDHVVSPLSLFSIRWDWDYLGLTFRRLVVTLIVRKRSSEEAIQQASAIPEEVIHDHSFSPFRIPHPSFSGWNKHEQTMWAVVSWIVQCRYPSCMGWKNPKKWPRPQGVPPVGHRTIASSPNARLPGNLSSSSPAVGHGPAGPPSLDLGILQCPPQWLGMTNLDPAWDPLRAQQRMWRGRNVWDYPGGRWSRVFHLPPGRARR